jgi:methionine aminopeptidase
VGTRLEYVRTLKSIAAISSEPIARANGCSSVRTYTGHGINDLFHCSPNVPHYAKNKAVGTMKAGMVRGDLLQRNVGN